MPHLIISLNLQASFCAILYTYALLGLPVEPSARCSTLSFDDATPGYAFRAPHLFARVNKVYSVSPYDYKPSTNEKGFKSSLFPRHKAFPAILHSINVLDTKRNLKTEFVQVGPGSEPLNDLRRQNAIGITRPAGIFDMEDVTSRGRVTTDDTFKIRILRQTPNSANVEIPRGVFDYCERPCRKLLTKDEIIIEVAGEIGLPERSRQGRGNQ